MARVTSWIALPGAAIVLLTSLVAGISEDAGVLVSLLVFTAWALVPYGVLHVLGRTMRRPWPVMGAGLAATALELGIRLSVFVFPQGSTAPIALVFSPLAVLLGAMPVGAAAGWLVGRAVAAGSPTLTMLSMFAGACALALTTLGVARPDLFPTTVYSRHRALARIGEPGIRIGNDTFVNVAVDAPGGWYLTGNFDGRPGDELAVVDRGTVQIFDGRTLQQQGSRALGGDAARWNWFSHLARSRGELVRIDTGGGFQETQALALDGTLRFRYHPDETLPPNALRDADLDADGETEFYASTQSWLTRLDSAGREVWRQAQRSTEIVALQPASTMGPAWVVSRVYGQPLAIWSPEGAHIADVPERDQHYRQVLGIVEWRGQRLIAYGGERLTLRTPDGSTAFEWSVPDMRCVAADAVRLDAGGEPVLIVQAVADRNVHRARLQIVDAKGTVRYDEVSEQLPHILTMRHDDGASTILASVPSLHAVQLRPESKIVTAREP
ncbi:MAG: hypothetical protein U0Q11_00945 [Vicinamibacterales bacterium]